jgi:hypothetical protein
MDTQKHRVDGEDLRRAAVTTRPPISCGLYSHTP